MNRIVREHYPAEKLPEDLREGLAPGARVRVSVEVEATSAARAKLRDIRSRRRGTFGSSAEVNAYVRALRDGLSDA
jgi:hypothetical protein